MFWRYPVLGLKSLHSNRCSVNLFKKQVRLYNSNNGVWYNIGLVRARKSKTAKTLLQLVKQRKSITIQHRSRRPHQGNKKFKETRNWIFISIHYIFIIYATFKG